MEISMFYNMSDDAVINKVLDGEAEEEGEIREAVNIMSPIVRFYSDAPLRYNYCYIPDFQRYYSITEVTCVSTGIYDVRLTEDVLMSFRGGILLLDAIIERQAQDKNFDRYIDDGSLVQDNMLFTRLYNYPTGFNEQPEYILITAG